MPLESARSLAHITYILMIVAFVAIVCMLVIKVVKTNQRSKAGRGFPFQCPYCHCSGGSLGPGVYKCHDCLRTVAHHTAPTPEQVAVIQAEEQDIAKLHQHSFDLQGIQEAVLKAYLGRPEFAYVSFHDSYVELTVTGGKYPTIATYPKLDTDAGIQALTHECLVYVKERDPLRHCTEYKEGHGFFDGKANP